MCGSRIETIQKIILNSLVATTDKNNCNMAGNSNKVMHPCVEHRFNINNRRVHMATKVKEQ